MYKVTFLKILDKTLMNRISIIRNLYHSSSYGKRVFSRLIGELSIQCEGLRLTGSLKHRHYLDGLLHGKCEPYTSELFKNTVKPEMVVCDIGSFLGFYALLAAQRIGPNGKVFAFEPDPLNFHFLKRNVEVNGFQNIITKKKALFNKNGQYLFFQRTAGDRSSLFNQKVGGEAFETVVNCVRLDDYLQELKDDINLDVVKLDVEGGEVQALQGMEQAVKQVSTIFVECNPQALLAAKSTPQELITILHDFGFFIEIINDKKRCLEPANLTEIRQAKYVNILCRRVK